MGLHMSEVPTTNGAWSGVDRVTGTRWAFEPADDHWRLHDEREVGHWRSRPPAERLAQAAAYRLRVHGEVAPPAQWQWRFLPPGQ